jgi:hypothetical protein
MMEALRATASLEDLYREFGASGEAVFIKSLDFFMTFRDRVQLLS